MSLSDRLVSGGSIRWTRLAETAVAAIALVLIEFYVGFVELVGGGIQSAQDGLGGFNRELIGSVIGIPISAASTASRELIGALGVFGPFGLVVAMVIVMLSGYILFVGVVRTVAIIREGIFNI